MFRRVHYLFSSCRAYATSPVNGLLVTKRNDKAILQFNRPDKLNAQSLEIQVALAEHLRDFESDPNVSAVIIKGRSDVGFSAGGDIVQFASMLETPEKVDYFKECGKTFYRGLLRLSEFKKPIVTLADGLCMGGGAAVAFFASHPVITERTVFAMPEVFIGFYPNVGANYFIGKLPKNIGMWLGLTGKRFKGSEIMKLGLVKNFIKSDDISKLEETIVNLEDTNANNVTKVISDFQVQPDFSNWTVDLDKIEKLFNGDSVEEIIDKLRNENTEFSNNVLKLFETLPPQSLKITFHLLHFSKFRNFSPNDALSADLSFFFNFYGGDKENAHDFREGLRSVLVDRNHKPNWKPKSLNQVSDDKVISYFTTNVCDVRSNSH